MRVIIADDVSTDATEHLSPLCGRSGDLPQFYQSGVPTHCNQAAKAARGKYVMFLNNDTQVTEGWLSSLVDLIESDPTIGMVGLQAGLPRWKITGDWRHHLERWFRLELWSRLDNPDKPEYNYVKDVDYISGAAILLSNDLWEADRRI